MNVNEIFKILFQLVDRCILIVFSWKISKRANGLCELASVSDKALRVN